MAYNRNQVRALLTDAEYELFVSSLADHIDELSPADLRKAITRTRKARDKASDLKRRQSASVREAAGSRGAAQTANQRTLKKGKAMAETLARFEQRLASLEAAEEREKRASVLEAAGTARPRKGAAKKGATKKAAAKKAAGANRASRRQAGKGDSDFMSSSAQAEATSARRGPQTRIKSSQAAAGRRGQAKRDKR